MPGVVRKGDKNDAGGKTLKGSPALLADGIEVCPITMPVSAHFNFFPPHAPSGLPKTAEGVSTFLVDGLPVCVIGNKDTCGHTRIEGSPTMIIGE